jgi:hypothetical protein
MKVRSDLHRCMYCIEIGWQVNLSQSYCVLQTPACWEVMMILRDDTTDLKVRGHHSTICVASLPWLPVNKVQDRFCSHLPDELNFMAKRHSAR